MVRITETLIRKRAEHNNLEISTLEEVSLHQQDIERIEFIDKWCRDLKILYLQSNLIPKIENVGRLKKLEYLNLALNNIEKVENLEGCESLKKLDLTVNFIGELTSIECLQGLVHFEELFLTGNPCADYEGFREYVIATLPKLKKLALVSPLLKKWHLDPEEMKNYHLIPNVSSLVEDIIRAHGLSCVMYGDDAQLYITIKSQGRASMAEKIECCIQDIKGWMRLDGIEVERSERIKAVQELHTTIIPKILEQQEVYKKKREREKLEAANKTQVKTNVGSKGHDGRWYTDINDGDSGKGCPGTAESKRKIEEAKDEESEKNQQKRQVRLQTDDGRILNVNEAKINFSLTDEEEENRLKLEVRCYKHLDTSLIDVDVQPTYVKVLIKGKVNVAVVVVMVAAVVVVAAVAVAAVVVVVVAVVIMVEALVLVAAVSDSGSSCAERIVIQAKSIHLVLQLVLSEEVLPDSSSAQRSQTTGHLLITMPKAKEIVISKSKKKPQANRTSIEDARPTDKSGDQSKRSDSTFLEVDPSKKKVVDLSVLTMKDNHGEEKKDISRRTEKLVSEDFIDDPDVPPLI
ncbi:Protein tilB-like [Holothuria leucospilota]|uniref:Protein tilB-like n=1 Tax=Holothuria leucospilota TaxID=206669 RepID=A0A9Q1BVZ2_HOLLE|nr:Protein tilB-like [Holothuria leucospilota]